MTAMALKVERDTLADAAALVARAAGKDGTMAGVRLAVEGGKCALAATNLDLWTQTTIAVAGGEDGVVVVSAKRLAEMVKALREGAVSVTVDGAVLRLASGVSKASLPTMRADEFPKLPDPVEGAAMDGRALRAALAQVTPAASHDDNRPILTGVLFEAGDAGLRLVATDSYRLAPTDVACEWNGEAVIVPATALREFLRLGDAATVMGHADDESISFGVGETVITSRLLAGEFPNYRRLISPAGKRGHRLEVDRDELVEAVKRVDVAAGEANAVRLDVDANTLRLSCSTTDVGDAGDELDVTWDGPALAVHFNAAFLLDALAAVSTERVALALADSLKPAHVTAVPADEFLGLNMPIVKH